MSIVSDENQSSSGPGAFGRVFRRRQQLPDGQSQGWWSTSRRKFIIGGSVAALGLAGVGTYWLLRDDTSEIDDDSLALQQKHGWNLGSEDKPLTLTGIQPQDSLKTEEWKHYLDFNAMLGAFQPAAPAWAPFFVPTLIQSLKFDTLRGQLHPISTPDMEESYQRGQTIGKDFLVNAQNRNETALIADLPGRDAVAFGAGLADKARLVTTFDNFPHPLGVTPSHETLGAMLYYAKEIQTKQTALPADAPVVFLLDSNRLAPYKDADTQFDNRYLAKVPSAQKLKENGIKSLVYLTPDRTRTTELDDLNEEFVDFKDNGLTVAMLPLSDFTPLDEQVVKQLPDGSKQTVTERHYYYGGAPTSHGFFFLAYPLYVPTPAYARTLPRATPSLRPPVAPPTYAPVRRPTMFAGSRLGSNYGVGRAKPSGFGRTTVRVNPSGGLAGTRAGRSGYYSPNRSGSFGRGGYSGS